MTKQCTQMPTASQLKQLVFIFNKKKTTPGKNILYGHNSPTSAAKNCILWKGEKKKKRREGKRKRGTNAVTLVVGCPFFFFFRRRRFYAHRFTFTPLRRLVKGKAAVKNVPVAYGCGRSVASFVLVSHLHVGGPRENDAASLCSTHLRRCTHTICPSPRLSVASNYNKRRAGKWK